MKTKLKFIICHSNMCIRRKVQKGTGTGQKIGYPTLNFNVGQFGKYYGEGVYVSEVRIGTTVYKGALYYGS
ncbi:MAG: riboflavin kinase, partial [Bacteroidota bacterium]|nr:riboflavin kinase [Bacteroidota bacterium]